MSEHYQKARTHFNSAVFITGVTAAATLNTMLAVSAGNNEWIFKAGAALALCSTATVYSLTRGAMELVQHIKPVDASENAKNTSPESLKDDNYGVKESAPSTRFAGGPI